MTVVLVKSDHVDKVGVVSHPSIALRAYIHRPDRITIGVISEPCCAPVGDSRVASPDRSSATFREAAQNDDRGSTSVGLALYGVAGLEVWGSHHESRYCRRLASEGLSPVLDLEDSTWETWATHGAEAIARVNSNDES